MWCPIHLKSKGPRFLAIVEALEADIAVGHVLPGEQLLPQRELAYRLGVSVGTVVHAYAVAEGRGLIAGEVGRGTYVRPPHLDEGKGFFGDGSNVGATIDLSLNVPPLDDQADILSDALKSLAFEPVLPDLLRYGPHTGFPAHRAAIADWIGRSGDTRFRPSPDQIVICHGAQHALTIILAHTTKPGETVLAEELTYAGFKAAAGAARLRIYGVEMDRDGLVPEALEFACQRTNARLLFVMPTLQNPTGLTMSEGRRAALIEIIRRYSLTVIEDDVYGFLCNPTPAALAVHIPEQVFYVGSFSKCLAPGLRVGFVVSPPDAVTGLEAGIRSTAWMATPIMVEVVARWLGDGTADKIARKKRAESVARRSMAQKLVGQWLLSTDEAAFHVWLPLPPPLTPVMFAELADERGVTVTPTESVVAESTKRANGVRLCLGAARDRAELARALLILKEIIVSYENGDAIQRWSVSSK